MNNSLNATPFRKKPLNRLTMLAAAIGLTISCSSALAKSNDQDMEARFKDGWVEGKVETIFLLNRNLNNFEIDAEVHGDSMVLTGQVDEEIDKDLAEAIARGIAGIKTVDNQITVAPVEKEKQQQTESSSLSQAVSDITTTTMVKGKLMKSPHIAGMAIDVDTHKGLVTLSGEVDSSAAKDLAWRLAKNTKGVVKVENNLLVKPNKTGESKL